MQPIYGTEGDDRLIGSAADEDIFGLGGNDSIVSGGGADSLYGGEGDDTLIAGQGTRLVYDGPGDDVVETSGVVNGSLVIVNGAGNDRFVGGSEYDALHFWESAAIDLWVDESGYGESTSASGNDTLTGIEHLGGSTYDDRLVIHAPIAYVWGNDGNDYLEAGGSLNGGRGRDTLVGTADTRFFSVDEVGDVVLPGASSGAALASSAPHYQLPLGILRGSLYDLPEARNLFGNAQDNLLSGNSGDNVLAGFGGTDTVDYLPWSVAAVQVDLSISTAQDTGGAGRDRLVGIENLIGTWWNDWLKGNDQWNRLDGNLGADTLEGGLGSDTYVVDNAGDRVIEVAAAPGAGNQDWVLVSGMAGYALPAGVENARPLQGQGIDLFGNGLDNTLVGGGQGGWLTGRQGNDSYVLNAADTRVVELSGEGTADWVHLNIGRFVLPQEVENAMVLSPQGAVVYGHAGDNEMVSGAGNDTLYGGGGTDTASYQRAQAAVRVDLGRAGPQDTGGDGVDQLMRIENLRGSAFGDQLLGNAGWNTLMGGLGADTLDGGFGGDWLYGGQGARPDGAPDLFVFSTALDARRNVDRIVAFEADALDRIQLDAQVFAALGGAVEAGELREGTRALDADDFLLFDPRSGMLWYDADADGPGAALAFARLVGWLGTLDASDFRVGGGD